MMDRDIDTPERPEPQQPREEKVDSAHDGLVLSRERENYELRGYRYQVSPSDMAALREIGRFRTIDADDLAEHQYRGRTREMGTDLTALQAQGLVQQHTVWTHNRSSKLNVVVLTKAGRELLEKNAPANDRQELHSGFVKRAEIAHDAAIYRMFQAERARIEREGGRVRRIVLDYELKQNVYRPLAKVRPGLNAAEYAKRQAEVAAANHLKVIKGKILLPDLRIEYESGSGVQAFIDLELATEHYRGGMMRGKAEAGFKLYAARESASGMAAAFDPELVADLFFF